MRLQHQKGFTLIELIISIAILTMVSSVAVVNYRSSEKQRSVATVSEIFTNAIRTAQNLTLTSKQITNSTCASGKAPQAYIIHFTSNETVLLYGIDKCNVANLVETFTKPPKTQIQANGYKLNNASVSSLQIKFLPPFGQITASSNTTINSGTFSSFVSATITVESTQASIARTITVDGVSGRIGE